MKSSDRKKVSEMISSDKAKIKDLIDETVRILYFMSNSEEYDIGRFIGITQKPAYKILIIIKIFLYAWLLFSFIFLPLMGKKDLIVDEIILTIYFFIQTFSFQYFGYSLSIYSIKRKRFLKYQKQMILIINNRNIHNLIQQNKELDAQIRLLNQKIDYIIKILKTPLDFLKSYQIIGFLSLIIPLLTFLFQNIILSIDILSYVINLITLVIVFLLLYVFPLATFWKQKDFKGYRGKLRENFDKIRRIQSRNIVVL